MSLRTCARLLPTVLGLALAACASGYDLSTPEGRALYQRDLAASQQALQQSTQFLNQQTQALQQAGAYQPPQVGTYGHQPSTAIVYCRSLTGELVACKQVN